jgi:hypothetical protein
LQRRTSGNARTVAACFLHAQPPLAACGFTHHCKVYPQVLKIQKKYDVKILALERLGFNPII